MIELSDREGLPKWLVGANVNQWERGNQWALEMAQTFGAQAARSFALRGGKREGTVLIPHDDEAMSGKPTRGRWM